MKKRILVAFFLVLITCQVYSQDPGRYQKEIKDIENKFQGKIAARDLIVFTGSSSIRRWEDLQDYFPGKNIINTAFGGSQMSDLIFYSDTVIIQFSPIQIFIYEGDNDLAAGKKPEDIIKEVEVLLTKIHQVLPGVQIVILSAKPSPKRWELRDEFVKLNSLFQQMAAGNNYILYLDLWTPLLSTSGLPRGELFTGDSLHINNDGYKIWADIIKKVIM